MMLKVIFFLAILSFKIILQIEKASSFLLEGAFILVTFLSDILILIPGIS